MHKAHIEPDIELHLMGALPTCWVEQAWVVLGQERQQDLHTGEEAAAGSVKVQLLGEATTNAIVTVPIGNLEALLHTITQCTDHQQLEAKKGRRRGEWTCTMEETLVKGLSVFLC